MNKCLFTGRFTREPEIRYTSGDNPICVARFSLAVDRDRRPKEDEPTADFPKFVAIGKNAEFIERYMHQGMKAEVETRYTTGSYINKEGKRVYTGEFTVEHIGFAEKKSASESHAAPQTDNIPGADDTFLAAYPDEELPFK